MTTRVLSTAEAESAIRRMQGIVNGGLVDQIRQLDAEGRVLSDPNIWDGALASEFRGAVWPDTKAALDKVTAQLEELRGRIEMINRNIMTAGGN